MKIRVRRYRAMKRKDRSYWGKRHSHYANGCIGCAAWRFYDEKGRFPYSFDECSIYCDSLRENVDDENWERPWNQV